MRGAAALALVAVAIAPAAAQDQDSAPPDRAGVEPAPVAPVERACADGVLVDRYWSLTMRADGLVETGRVYAPLIFRGRTEATNVDLLVYEYDGEREATAIRDACSAAWQKDERALRDVKTGERQPLAWLAYVERDRSQLDARHVWAFAARSYQVFLVHVSADAAEEGPTTERLLDIAASLQLDDDRGANLVEWMYARKHGLPSDSVEAIVAAVDSYPRALDRLGIELPAFGDRVARRAIERTDGREMSEDDEYKLKEVAGLSYLAARELPQAVRLLERCVRIAPETTDAVRKESRALYNLACAHALGGDADAAFAAIASALAVYPIVDRAHMLNDHDLDSLHDDPRWPKAVERAPRTRSN